MEEWPVLKFFRYEHLPAELQKVSKQFHDLAHSLVDVPLIENYGEMAKALDRLLEAKDAAVRAFLLVRG